jgi:hypothetical protein
MVVLDTHEDWRFAKNVSRATYRPAHLTTWRPVARGFSRAQPLVLGAPHVRFYAGAPLRTQDGFNVGTLAIMDDVPHHEFSPRQRHTLKEFAVRLAPAPRQPADSRRRSPCARWSSGAIRCVRALVGHAALALAAC